MKMLIMFGLLVYISDQRHVGCIQVLAKKGRATNGINTSSNDGGVGKEIGKDYKRRVM